MATQADIKLAIACGNAQRLLCKIFRTVELPTELRVEVTEAVEQIEAAIDPIDDGGNVDESEGA